MYRNVLLASFVMLALVPFGAGSPRDGSLADFQDIGPQMWTTTKTFRGGERTCVLAVGDHKDAVTIEVQVFEVKNGKESLVVSDKTSNALVSDYAGVIWYPPRDGEYRVEVRTSGTNHRCYIAVK